MSNHTLFQPMPANSARALAASFPARILVLMVVHIPIGLLIRQNVMLATLHALLLPALGLFFIMRDAHPRRLMLVVSYMAGAETLWRLRTALNFEYDKYAIGLLLILALLKYGRERRVNWLPLLYFSFLLPGLFYMPLFDRETVAFNLAGPALLAIAAAFFSIANLNRSDLRNFLIALLLPIISVAAIAAFSTATTENIVFTGGTNPFTSGGDGGNQISAMLGLGALAALLLVNLLEKYHVLRLTLVGTAVILLAQSAFTFSRGGFYTAIGAILVFGLFSLKNRRQRIFLLLGLPLIILGLSLIFPILDSFSGGLLLPRLQSTDTTGRDLIALQDLRLFVENLPYGVGVGESIYAHIDVFRLTQPHTEPTRMLAEHGIPGLLALLILLILAVQRLFRSSALPEQKSILISLIAWSLATTLHVAMRLAAPSILFGFGALVTLVSPQIANNELEN